MPDRDEQSDDGLEELEEASRVNFRDYPSSALVVVFAALSSGLGWMAYRWMGKKRKALKATPDAVKGSGAPAHQEKPSSDRKA